jgi:hypothetical protein
VPTPVEIAGIHPHAGPGLAVFAKCDAGRKTHFPKSAVMLIAIQLVGLGVVGHQKIGPSVFVVVEHRDTQRF